MVAYGQKKRLFVYDWPLAGAAESFAPIATQPYSVFLDSSSKTHPLSRYSYIGWHPFETIESKDGRVSVSNAENQFTYNADVFQVVRERLALWGENLKFQKDLPPFQGGAIGFFGYDLARNIEKLPDSAGKSELPDLCIGLYDKVIAFDHQESKAWLMIWAADEKTALMQKTYIEQRAKEPIATASFNPPLEWHAEKTDQGVMQDIARTIEYIYAGDIFQANISRGFGAYAPPTFNAFNHYCYLRDINAAPFGAYLNFGGFCLSSSSPERFIEVKGRGIETRPIKGTLSSALPAMNLADSEKDRAENIMIVDLLRNDLSKCCEDHSVEISNLCAIETFEGLHHMVSTVKGTLRGDHTAVDALRACFPGGSITGAPKIRAMEIIDDLEKERRGPYCGAIGWVSFNGDMDTSIAIRTLIYTSDKVTLRAGAGITALSNPAQELAEINLKAEKILESFGCQEQRRTA